MIGGNCRIAACIAFLIGLLVSDAAGFPADPAAPTDQAARFVPLSVTDDSYQLVIPDGESYELYGRHMYTVCIEINGTLAVTPYEGINTSTGTLELEAPRIYIGPNGRMGAAGRGSGGGGGATVNRAEGGGGRGGWVGTGGNGDTSPPGSSMCGGGGGGSNGGPGGAGGPPGRDGTEGSESGGGKGGDYFNGYTGNYGGGNGGTGFGGGGGGGAGYGWGGGGGGGGGTGGKNASGQTGGAGAGPARGDGGRSQTMPGPESHGRDGGYMSPGQNGDASIDNSLMMGSGGGGGGTGAMYSGGGGGGGAGGGAVILDAKANISILGAIYTTGSGGGKGGLEIGNTGSGSGGNGGGGGGGGISITGQNVTVIGILDSRGRVKDTLSELNGGTVKIFYTKAYFSGNITSGRTYVNGRPLMQGLLFPTNGTGTTDMPVFRWKAARDPDLDAVRYQLQVSNESSFGSPWVNISNLTETQAAPPVALSGKDLFWRVRASDHFGCGPWSETGRFTVDVIPPVSRVDSLPEFINRTDVVVSWNGTDAQTGIANYTIYLSIDGNNYTAWQNRTNGTSAVYRGDDAHSYCFYSLAVDKARNSEPAKSIPDAFTTIDTVPPESAVTPMAKYQTSANFTVGWTGNDVTSGIASWSIFVSENFGPFETWMENVSGSSAMFHGLEGHRYTFYGIAKDRAGNVEDDPFSQEFVTTRVDGSAPSTTLTIGNPRFGMDPVFVSPASAFQFKPTDNYAGVTRTLFIIDERPAREYNGSFVESELGHHNITYWSVDAAGNEEPRRTVWFFVDSGPPETNLFFEGPSFVIENRSYIAGGTKIGFEAWDDGSGVARTVYRLDGVEGGASSDPFSAGKYGSHLLMFHSVDNLGTSEPEQVRTIIVDLYPPTTIAAASSRISNVDVKVTLNSSDPDSGTANTFYRTGRKGAIAGDFQTGKIVDIPARPDHSLDGIYSIEFYSVDNVGNCESAKTLEISIDTICNLALHFKTGILSDTDWFEAGGVSEHGARISINGNEVNTNSEGNFTFEINLKEGRNKIVVSAIDPAGNTAIETRYVTFSKAAGGTNWLALLIAAAVFAISLVALIIWKKRRKRHDPLLEML